EVGELRPHARAHPLRVVRRGREARTDRPHGLVRHHEALGGDPVEPRERAPELREHDLARPAGVALLAGLAHAQHGHEPRLQGARDLLPHDGVVLAVVLPPLRVADDGVGGAGVGDHRGRYLARVRALGVGGDVLRPQRDGRAERQAGHARQVRERHHQRDVARQRLEPGQAGEELARPRRRLAGQLVHLPVASHKGPAVHPANITRHRGRLRPRPPALLAAPGTSTRPPAPLAAPGTSTRSPSASRREGSLTGTSSTASSGVAISSPTGPKTAPDTNTAVIVRAGGRSTARCWIRGATTLPCRSWTVRNSAVTHSRCVAPRESASSAAGTKPTSGPNTGTSSARPAMMPSTRASGTPISDRPSHVTRPTSVIETSWPSTQPRSARYALRVASLAAARRPRGRSLTSPSR